MTTTAAPTLPRVATSGGLLLGIGSAAAFGVSGSLAAGLLAAGWSPAALVTIRLGIGSVVLAPFALRALAGRWALLVRHWPRIAVFGVVTMALCQLFYFGAVQRLPVAVALLLEYAAPLLIVALAWLTTRRVPHPLTLLGCLAAMGGLALLLDLGRGTLLDPLGVLLGLGAAVCLAAYFLLSARAGGDLPVLVLVCGGMLTATISLLAVGGLGLVPFTRSGAPVMLMSVEVPVLVPLLALGVLSAAIAYLTGVVAARRLGGTFASFVGLSEVLFAVLFAWLLVGQQPGPGQAIGGLVVLLGVAAIKLGQLRHAA